MRTNETMVFDQRKYVPLVLGSSGKLSDIFNTDTSIKYVKYKNTTKNL